MGWPTDADIERNRINEAERQIVQAEENWKEQRIAELEAAIDKAIWILRNDDKDPAEARALLETTLDPVSE